MVNKKENYQEITLASSKETQGSKPNPLVQLDPGLFIWTILTFLLLCFALAKFAWKPLLKALKTLFILLILHHLVSTISYGLYKKDHTFQPHAKTLVNGWIGPYGKVHE